MKLRRDFEIQAALQTTTCWKISARSFLIEGPSSLTSWYNSFTFYSTEYLYVGYSVVHRSPCYK